MLKYFLLLVLVAGGKAVAPFHDPHCDQDRQIIVEVFNWKWKDIALECERFFGPKGYCGVQISPPNEHIIDQPRRSWTERYNPVSYRLTSRSGTEFELRDMITRCRKAGVRVYVDAVFNHMAKVGLVGNGSDGSFFDASKRQFPGVPYSVLDFNMAGRCPNSDNNVHNYDDVNDVRNCNLDGRADLWQEKSWVRRRIADYLNTLIGFGVAGFRVDSAKHMWPGDLKEIFSKLHWVDEKQAFIYLDVVPGGVVRGSEYWDLGYVTEFNYAYKMEDAMDDLKKLQRLVGGSDMTPSDHALVFVDNHDTQRAGHLHFSSPLPYMQAVAFTFAYDYGFPVLTSSYYFLDAETPPPHDGDVIKDVIINKDGTCDNGWVCEHRWKVIANMVTFRRDVINTNVTQWKVQGDVTWLTRGHVGFFAMGKSGFKLNTFTGLPEGEYCDLMSDCAQKISVDKNGMASISPYNDDAPFVVFTTTSQDGAKDVPAPSLPSYVPPSKPDFRKTVILMRAVTVVGEDLFIRGGVSHNRRPGCLNDVRESPCVVPIRHLPVGQTPHYEKYNAWAKGDNYLDWYGSELNQGQYQQFRADGTPLFWSTNDTTNPGYSPYNTLGPHYWTVSVEMDCSMTNGGYFEFKVMLNGEWEQINGDPTRCTGNSVGTIPFRGSNHIGRCGYLNVFNYQSRDCTINSF